MSEPVREPNHSHAISLVVLLLVLSSLHLHAKERHNPSGKNRTGGSAGKSDIPFQNDIKKLLYLIRQDRWQLAGPFAYQLAKRSRSNDDAADACGLYALVLLRAGYPQLATDEAKQAMELGAGNYWALVASGHIELWNGRTAQAQKFFRRATQVRPQGADGRLGSYLSARPGSMEQVRAMFAYLALAPTGHPHDQMVAYLTSLLKGHNPLWGATAKSPEAISPKVIFEPTAHQVSDRSSPTEIQESPVVIPMTCEGSGLYVMTLVEGHPMKLLLDTGAGESITLTPQAARRLLLLRLGTSTISGIQGSEQSTDYVAKTLQLGPLRWTSMPIRTVAIGSCDGILGVGFLGHYVVSLDLAHQVMRLTASAEAPRVGTSRQSLPFHEYQQSIMFPAQVGGQDVWADLDTGSASTTASKRIAETLAENLPASIVERATSMGKSGIGKTDMQIFRLRLDQPFAMVWGQKPLQVNLTVPDLEGGSFLDDEISPRRDFEVGMLVGMSSLLSFQQVIIDYKHQCLFFDTYTKRKGNEPTTNVGT